MLDIAQLFIPLDRRRALAQDISLADRVQGAALFADVSGFTPLTEKLAREFGPQRGAEELTQQMNRVFDALIHEADQYGGSVIGFSGDAITCWFDGDDGWRATTCALAMQSAMTRLNADANAPPIALKIAIACGAARRFQVGDPALGMIDVLAGATLDRLAAGEHLATRGEILLDAASAHALEQRLTIQTWRTAAPDEADASPQASAAQYAVVRALAPPAAPQAVTATFPLTEAQVRPWVLSALYERIAGGQRAFLAELRPVVTLFLRFRGIDFDGDDAAGDKLDQFVRLIQRIAARYEGTLIQIPVGDKGSYAMLAFGALQAHDDDAGRAVSAAIEMRDHAGALPFIHSIQIGISRGMMFAGAYGGRTRQAYATMGDETNVAARLMQHAAPGQIIVSERLADALPARYRLDPMGEVQVKGKDKPIPLYQVVGLASLQVVQTSARTSPAVLVGRAAEQAELTASLNVLRAGSSGMLVIEGDAGLGKSQLAAEFLTQARDAGVFTLFGSAEAIELATPYFAWRAVVRALLGLTENEERDAVRQRVLEVLEQENLTPHAPLLNALLPFDFPENDLTAQMSGEVRAENLHALVLRLLQARAQTQPLLLVIEDVHWLDSASWALVHRAARQVQPLLQVLTLRPPGIPLPAYYAQLVNVEGVTWLELSALPPEATTALVAQRLGVNTLSAPLAALIRERAEGNPFFSIELAYALRDANLLEVADGQARLAPGVELARLTLPDTVQGVITSRIDRLSPSQQLTVKVASVIGRVFAFRILRDVEPVEAYRATLPGDLDALDQLELAELETPDPNLAYHFKHLITQEVAYNLMLFAQRRELHRAVAQWYEGTYAENLAPYYALLTYHWGQAEERGRTMDYAERAGKEALSASAYQEAVEFFQRVLELDAQWNETGEEAQARRARVLRMLGAAYRRWGRLAEAQTNLERAAELYGYPSPVVKGNLPPKLIGQVLRQTGHRLRAPQPVTSERARQQLREAAQIYEMLAELYFFAGKRGASLYSSIHMLNLAEPAGPSPELARAYANTSLLAGLFGMHGLSETYYQRALKTAESVNIPATRADVERANALYRSGMGQWDRVAAQVNAARVVHQQLGDKRYWGDCIALLATAAYYQAEYARAQELYAQIATEQHGIALHQVWGLTRQGGIAVRQGDYARAQEFLAAAQPLVDATREQASQISNYGFWAATHLALGETNEALRDADNGLALISSSGGPAVNHALDGYFYIAEIYAARLESPDLPDAERAQFYKQLKQILKAWNAYCRLYPIGQPGRLLFQGLAYALSNKPHLAVQSWHKAIAASQRFQMPYEGARAEFEIGRHLKKDDPARREHLQRAAETFARLGARADAERAREAL